MLKKNEVADPNSCINRAEDDEPVFVIRANDPLMPKVVQFWANEYQQMKLTLSGVLSEAQYQKFQEALQIADQAREWYITNREDGS